MEQGAKRGSAGVRQERSGRGYGAVGGEYRMRRLYTTPTVITFWGALRALSPGVLYILWGCDIQRTGRSVGRSSYWVGRWICRSSYWVGRWICRSVDLVGLVDTVGVQVRGTCGILSEVSG